METLIALSIFTFSVLGLMSVLSAGISDTTYAKKKITAAYLSQEGVEYFRNLRDTYVLYAATGAEGWTAFNNKITDGACHQGNGCYFDDRDLDYDNQSQPMTGITLTGCGSSCPALLYDSASGKYGYGGGVDSGYVRKIQAAIVSSNEVKISSTVYWTQNSGTYQITLSENLFNWVE